MNAAFQGQGQGYNLYKIPKPAKKKKKNGRKFLRQMDEIIFVAKIVTEQKINKERGLRED